MDATQAGSAWRTAIGGVIGAALCIAIYEYGQAYAYAHVPASTLFQYYYLFFFSRVPWILLMGLALALVGNLASVRLAYQHDSFALIMRIAAIGLGMTIAVVTIQQFLFQGLPFFFDFFLILALNVGWFLFVAFIPFMALAIVLNFMLGFTRPARSAREIMPAELLAEHEQQRSHRR